MSIHLLRGGDPALLADAVSSLVHDLVGDEDRALVVDDITEDDYEVARIVDAARTPPFLTSKRVVVARHIEQFTRQDDLAPLMDYLSDPLDTTELVLAAGGTVHRSLVDAVKKHKGQITDTDPGRAAREWLKEQFDSAEVKLDSSARDLVTDRLGEDLGRLPALLDGLEATYGPGARLGEDEVEPFLGEAGGVPPWELTDAIDRGDTAAALDRLGRMMGGGERHPLQILATLSGHYGRVLRLSGSEATDEKSAAALLNLKGSTFPARKALDQARRLGPQGVARAYELLAGADLDMRGRVEWPDELLLEVLVARLSRLGGAAGGRRPSGRGAPARTARRPASS